MKKVRINIVFIALILSVFSICKTVKANSSWNKYKFTEKQIKGIARVCQNEQGTPVGAAAEASLMANRYELYKTSSGTGEGLYNYVRNSGWWANARSGLNNWKSVDNSIYKAVNDALANGNRTLPQYVDEHDCWNCNSSHCKNGNRGDICSITTDGKTVTSMSSIKNRSSYKSGKTVITNLYGAKYTFYTFPTDSSDPFGYTDGAYKKADKSKKPNGSGSSSTDGNQKSSAELEFYNRVEEVYNELEANGSDVEPALVAAVFYVSNIHGQMKYKDFTTEVIRDIFKYMNSDPEVDDDEALKYDEESFKENLLKYWFTRDEFKDFSDEEKEKMVQEVIDHFEDYKILMGVESSKNKDGVCSYNVSGETLSNVSVKLMHCEGKKNLNEDPYDLEDYVTGVIAPEIGEESPLEAQKVQAVAARSFAITRWKSMGGAYGVTKKESNGATTLFLRSCTTDQVFCNADKGCWANSKNGGQIDANNPSDWPNHTIYSGYDSSKAWSRKELAETSQVRKAAEETKGEYLVDKDGNALSAPFLDSDQQQWIALAKKGYDYYEILKKHYPDVATIKSDCTSTGNAEAENWKQTKGPWAQKKIGSKTIAQIGCMVTSAAIQIARSGTKLLVADFDPGVFMETIKANGAFTGNDWTNMNDSTWASLAPNFKLGGLVNISGSRAQKIKTMKEYSTNNKYLIIRVYHPGQHWIAVTKVEGDKIYIADPSSDATDFDSNPTFDISNVSAGYYFIKED